jgi:non-ribosomal peptide synthetase component F
VTAAIHRLVEEQAASRVDADAVIGATEILTYRDLNSRANALARALMARGFHRGGHALVVLERGPELAVVLLAVLKAGGCYTWLEPSAAKGFAPRGVSIANGLSGDVRYTALDLESLRSETHSSANLPVLMRASDVAVVMPAADASGDVLVPHASVTSLLEQRVPKRVQWGEEPAAIDLWLGLMTGATITLADPLQAAA